jgi:hypothetical protein
MKKTLTTIIAAVMVCVMGITVFAAPTVPEVLPDNADTLLDAILSVLDDILGFIGEIAGLLFK